MTELILQVLDPVHVVALVEDALQSLALVVLDSRHVFHFFLKLHILFLSFLELVFQLNDSAEAFFVLKSLPQLIILFLECLNSGHIALYLFVLQLNMILEHFSLSYAGGQGTCSRLLQKVRGLLLRLVGKRYVKRLGKLGVLVLELLILLPQLRQLCLFFEEQLGDTVGQLRGAAFVVWGIGNKKGFGSQGGLRFARKELGRLRQLAMGRADSHFCF